ncbi:uncharacterized protein BYT42DRAFT_553914, partial [Radiomyces spectabilis]
MAMCIIGPSTLVAMLVHALTPILALVFSSIDLCVTSCYALHFIYLFYYRCLFCFASFSINTPISFM